MSYRLQSYPVTVISPYSASLSASKAPQTLVPYFSAVQFPSKHFSAQSQESFSDSQKFLISFDRPNLSAKFTSC